MLREEKVKDLQILMKATLIFALTIISHNNAVVAEWKAGVSSIKITPQESVWMAGYGARTQPSQGIVSDLHVKALALADNTGKKIVIVTSDLVGFYLEFTDSIAEAIRIKYGIPRDAILFNVSHTHCGPEIRQIRMPEIASPEIKQRNGEYTQFLSTQFVAVISKALENMKDAEVSFSSLRATPFAVSRRLPAETGIQYRSTPSSFYTRGDRDDVVPVLRVMDTDRNVMAFLFGYACHPITLGFDYISADYPGFAQQYVEEAFPGAVAMFVQGCAGELVPNSRYTVEYAQGHGRALADAVIKSHELSSVPLKGPVGFAYEKVTLHFVPLPEKSVLEQNLKSRNQYAHAKAQFVLARMEKNEPIDMTLVCPVQAFSFGKELTISAIGGETTTGYSVRTKAETPGDFVWVAGYSNNIFGYLPTYKILKEGGYESSERYTLGPFTDDVEERVMSGLKRVIEKAAANR